MSDIYTILQSGYTNAALNASQQGGQYVAVDPKAYQGTWSGTFSDNKAFTVQISNVSGYKATVRFQSGATNQYQQVLIKNNAFRIGDTKFTLAGNGVAQVNNVVTDPVYGTTSLRTGYAQQTT